MGQIIKKQFLNLVPAISWSLVTQELCEHILCTCQPPEIRWFPFISKGLLMRVPHAAKWKCKKLQSHTCSSFESTPRYPKLRELGFFVLLENRLVLMFSSSDEMIDC